MRPLNEIRETLSIMLREREVSNKHQCKNRVLKKQKVKVLNNTTPKIQEMIVKRVISQGFCKKSYATFHLKTSFFKSPHAIFEN